MTDGIYPVPGTLVRQRAKLLSYLLDALHSDKIVIINVSGRGDKDVESIEKYVETHNITLVQK